jgi:hypothetical protein
LAEPHTLVEAPAFAADLEHRLQRSVQIAERLRNAVKESDL